MNIDAVSILQSTPFLAIFACLGLGYWLGRLQFKGLTLSSTGGILIVSLMMGTLGITPPPAVGDFGFMLFIYGIGLQAGPNAFKSLQQDIGRYLSLTAIVILSALGVALSFNRWSSLPDETIVGILAGSLTSTPTLAAAKATVENSTTEHMDIILSHLGSGYASTYLVGLLGIVLFVKAIPLLFKLDLASGLETGPELNSMASPPAPVTEAPTAPDPTEYSPGSLTDWTSRSASYQDLALLGLSLAMGLLIGTITIKVGAIDLGLGSTGGLLLSGMVVSVLESRQSQWIYVPPQVRTFMIELGLSLFMVTLGLETGPTFFRDLQTQGSSVIGVGLVMAFVPMILGYLWARWVLKMNPALSLGGITGAMTSTPALTILIHDVRSTVPVISYAGTYVIANIVLTLIGAWLMGAELP